MTNPFKHRSLMDMSELASDIGNQLSGILDQHKDLGAVLVLYQLPEPSGEFSSAMSFTATDYQHIVPVLREVLKLAEKHHATKNPSDGKH